MENDFKIFLAFSFIIHASLFGFFGVLLALPAAAILLVTLRFARKQYEQSEWFRKNKKDQ
jgi:predicted PurR-regulated permease PerM